MFAEPGEVGFTAGLNAFFESDAHGARVTGDGQGRIDQHGVGAHFHRFRGMGWRSESGIDDYGHRGLLDDNCDVVAGSQPLVGADRRSKRHDRRRAGFLKMFGQDRVGVDVGQNDKTFFDQDFCGLEGFDRIRQQVIGVRRDFEFDPGFATCCTGNPGQANRFLGIARATGVGQQQVAFGVDMFEHAVLGIVYIHPAQRNGNDLAA